MDQSKDSFRKAKPVMKALSNRSISESSSTNSTILQSDESSCLGERVVEHREAISTYHVQITHPLSLPVPIAPISSSPADYVWEHYAESAIRPALTVCPKATINGSALDELAEYKERFALVDRISQAQAMHIRGGSSKDVFACLLNSSLLELTKSKYGFIGQVEREADKSMSLRLNAVSHVSWDEATRIDYETDVAHGLKFTCSNVNPLVCQCLEYREPIISNDLAHSGSSSHSTGLPPGLTSIDHFLGIPLFSDKKILGMVGIFNRPGGYSDVDLQFLEPFVVACSSLMQSYQQKELNQHLIDTLVSKIQEKTDKLQEANAALAEAASKAKQASQMQLQTFACASHEIRTPLNCIMGLSSLLQETKLDARQADAVQMMISSGDLLLTAVNDVLDFSKLETGHVDIEIHDTSLQETLNTVIHSIETKASAKKVSIHVHCCTSVPSRVQTDGRRLQQILYNLLGNAVKFSPASSRVMLKVSTVDSKDHKFNFLRFEVIDHGKGIPKSDFDRIFEPFKQSGSDTEAKFGGTGLGLAITLKLVKTLGGTIRVESEMGKETKFTVNLPMIDTSFDKQRLTSSMRSTSIALVGGGTETRIWLSNVAKDFDLSVTMFDCLPRSHDLPALDRHCAFLIDEDLYDLTWDKKQRESNRKTSLFTFGSTYKVQTSDGHFRCLERMVPSDLLECLAAQAWQSDNTKPLKKMMKARNHMLFGDVRVLVAEDNIINQKVLLRLLKQIGIKNVKVVDNGKKAADLAVEEPFDVVLMDNQMPVMSGLEACRLILADDRVKEKPKIIFVTAQVSQDFCDQCRQAGCTEFLPKPYSLTDIEMTFRKLKSGN